MSTHLIIAFWILVLLIALVILPSAYVFMEVMIRERKYNKEEKRQKLENDKLKVGD